MSKILKPVFIVLICVLLAGCSRRGHISRFPELDTHPVPGQTTIEGEFDLVVNQPLNKSTKVRYILPVDPVTGRPTPGASRLVFYAPFTGNAKSLKYGLSQWLRNFAQKYDHGLFTLTIETSTESINDHERYHIYPEAGWYEIVFAIEHHIRSQFGLKEEKLRIVGESSGGSMAQQMSITYPDRIEAAAWAGGSTYLPITTPIPVKMLALSTWGDAGEKRTRAMADDARKIGQSILCAVPPPLWVNAINQKPFERHSPWQLHYDLITHFIVGAPCFDAEIAVLPPPDFDKMESYDYPPPADASTGILILWDPAWDTSDGEGGIALKDILYTGTCLGFQTGFIRDSESETPPTTMLLHWKESRPSLKSIRIFSNRMAPDNLPDDVLWSICESPYDILLKP